MKSKARYGQKVLRFRRWSRNAAASFHSVNNMVNIGRLRASVQEQIAQKCAKMLLAFSPYALSGSAYMSGVEEDDPSQAPPDELQQELMLQLLQIQEPASPAHPTS